MFGRLSILIGCYSVSNVFINGKGVGGILVWSPLFTFTNIESLDCVVLSFYVCESDNESSLVVFICECVCVCACVCNCLCFVCNANDGFSGVVHQFVKVCVCVCVSLPFYIQGVLSC